MSLSNSSESSGAVGVVIAAVVVVGLPDWAVSDGETVEING